MRVVLVCFSVLLFSSLISDALPIELQAQSENCVKAQKLRQRNGGVRKPAAWGWQKPTTRKETRQKIKMQRLEAINWQWGFGGEGDVREEGEQVIHQHLSAR